MHSIHLNFSTHATSHQYGAINSMKNNNSIKNHILNKWPALCLQSINIYNIKNRSIFYF